MKSCRDDIQKVEMRLMLCLLGKRIVRKNMHFSTLCLLGKRTMRKNMYFSTPPTTYIFLSD